MSIIVGKIELKSAKEFRRLGCHLEKVMRKVEGLNYGIYTIVEEHKHLFLIIESMRNYQERINKDVRVIGDFNTKKVEIYDLAMEQEQMDDMVLDLNL